MVLLFFTLAILVALARERLLAGLRSRTVQLKRWGGVVLIGVGVWLIALALWAADFAAVFPV